MTKRPVIKIAKESIEENKNVLTAMGKEQPIKLSKNPDQDLLDVLDQLKDLMPKSTVGKVAVIGLAALLAYAILKSK